MASVNIRTRDTAQGRRFDVRYRRGGRYTPTEHGGTFQTKREAEIRRRLIGEWLAAAKDPRLELARATITVGVPFRVAQEDWIASRLGVGEGTLEGYRYRAPVLLEAFGKKTCEQITRDDVMAWVRELSGRYKPGTVRLFASQLKMVLDFADLPANVARDRRIELPRRQKSEIVPPTAEQMVAILEHCAPKYRLPLITMEQLGSRVSETLKLAPIDVYEATGQVRFKRENTKGGYSGRVVPAPEFLVEALAERLPFHGIPSRNAPYAAMRSFGFGPHNLRHRRISLWYQQGMSPPEVAHRSGHATATLSLDVYAHVMPLSEIPQETLLDFLK